ncbi:restriction endonuclease subunit S [Helicobacter pylori]
MHKIERLLQTLAPKGVEFKTLEEVFEIKNGYTPSKNNPEFWKNGTIPWFRMEDIRENGRILKDSIQHITPKALKGKKLFPKNSIIISTTATIGEHALLIVDSLANQRFTFLSKKANCDLALDMKFFFYQCFLLGEWCKNNTNVSGFASVDMSAFKKYKFPIPPLEIQQEIVKILDAFTELNTELNARKKQYEYYQNMLLDFNDINQSHKDAKMSAKTYPKRLKTLLQTLAPKGVEFKKIGEICLIKRGRVIAKTILQENGKYPVYSSQTLNNGILGFIDTYDFDGEFLTWTTDGAYAGSVFYRNGRFSITNVCGLLQVIQDNILHKYLYYILQITAPLHVSSGMGNPKLMSAAMQQITIPIPPLEIQQEIVKILDAFTELNTELNARKKQYEYYREKLLTFKPLTPNKEVKG